MRVLVVDDEAPARVRMQGLLGEIGNHLLVGSADSGQRCIELATRHRPDVVLLDIRMPGMDGIETARHLARLDGPPAVIFVTAYDEFALHAFDAQAIDYLLKPVRRERLAEALARAARPTRPQLAALNHAVRGRRRRIAARLGETLRLIPVDTIRCFLADQKYVAVHHEGGTDLIDEPLRELATEFETNFIRVHRNALVASKFVRALEKNPQGQLLIHVDGVPEPLVVSRRNAADVRKRIEST